ncbi:MAG: xanthine permease XanP [Candidatus Riflebacteria bacterium GWC2_50_8]|nr:MAG: xanthine permease XanP [Candidatus Riflebacteria bacterium GWC2_50_8]
MEVNTLQNNKTEALRNGLIYGVGDRPPFVEALFAALQHLLAIAVSIMTPALIVCGVLGINLSDTGYIVSMSLLVSGVATFIQVKRIGPVGSGLLSIQGTSFAFIGVLIAVGKSHVSVGGSPESALPLMFGLCFVGSFIEIVCSRFIKPLRTLITPLVSGIVVTLIGMTLIASAMKSCAGGQPVLDGFLSGKITAAVVQQNLMLAGLVLITILVLNSFNNRWIRMSSIFVGLLVGYVAAIFMGKVDFSSLAQTSLIAVPVPFKYGFDFDFSVFLGIALLYLVTMVETIGDITATSLVSGEPIEGDLYLERVSGGVLGDGFNSLLAAVFNTFPNTTFSQNNGIIQLTGVASRYVGYFVAVILTILGLIPYVAAIAALMPAAVLGGATFLMFGTVASSGIRIIASQVIDRRGTLILAVSLATGLGVSFEPGLVEAVPVWLHGILSSGIIAGGLVAIILNFALPGSPTEYLADKQPEVGINPELD